MVLLTVYLSLASLLIFKESLAEKSWTKLNSDEISVKVFKEKASFWDARSHCLKEYKSDLVIVHNMNDSDVLAELLRQSNVNSSWIGLTDNGHEGSFTWVHNNSSSNFSLWKDKFPKDLRKASDCVIMQRNNEDKYLWIDTHCTSNYSFICMRSLKTGVTSPSLLPHHLHYINQCPKPFFQLDGDCFWVSRRFMTWSESRQLCYSKGPESDLASIRTVYQQEYFAALVSGSFSGYWIGLNFNIDAYQWILQQDLKFYSWGKNQPNDSIKKNCTYISTNEDNLGNWNTAYCTDNFQAICQTLKKNNAYSVNESANTPDLTYDNVLFKKGMCKKPGYYYYHGSCYKLYREGKLNYNEAIQFCKNRTFQNQTGFNFLVNVISLPSAGEKKLILADLRRHQDLGDAWINIRGNSTYLTKLKPTEVSPSRTFKHLCFKLLTNGVVNSSDCDDNYKSTTICKYQLDNFNEESLKSNKLKATCPNGWKIFNFFCYFFDPNIYRTQIEAQKFCLKNDSSLTSINMFDQEFLSGLLRQSLYPSTNFNVWIGLEARSYLDKQFKFKWSNNQTVTYTNLESINVPKKREKWCTVLILKSGLWKLVNCTKERALILCQRPAYIKSISNKKNIKATLEMGYKLVNERLSWSDANNKCKGMLKNKDIISTLATIHSYDESKIIRSMKGKKIDKMFWIGLGGLYDHSDNVFLKWADGSNVKFQNYQYENLMNLTGSENCVATDIKSGKWFATNCDMKLPFICRIMNKTSIISKETKLSNIFSGHSEIGSLFCPVDFVEYSGKCFRVVDDYPLDYESADQHCQTLVPPEYHKRASLASIETRFENSFVYSLLSSSLHSTNETRYWIGERYINGFTDSLCAGISSHPDPYIGARWFAEKCYQKMKFICSSLKIPKKHESKITGQCPDDCVEYESDTGTYCYHFESIANKFEGARSFCSLKKNTLLSLPSHFHFHFILSQFEQRGLSRDSPIWLGLEIEQKQNLYHWQWDDGQDVRYTIWNNVPNVAEKGDKNLCFYFLQEKDKNGHFGMQIGECDQLERGYIICEHFIKKQESGKNVASNKNCISNYRSGIYEGSHNTTTNGLRCVRWDLLSRPNPTIQSIRNEKGIHNYVEYHANECRFISYMQRMTTFCATQIEKVNDSLVLQECAIESCGHKILSHKEESILLEHHSNVMTVVIVTLMLLLCVIACIALLSWRRFNKSSLFGGYLRRGQFAMLNSQPRGTSFNNPVYSPVSC